MTTEQWHAGPDNRTQLAEALKDKAVVVALGILQDNAKVRGVKGNDPVALALEHKRLEGYQEALDDLGALASIPKEKMGKAPKPFAHITTNTQSDTQ